MSVAHEIPTPDRTSMGDLGLRLCDGPHLLLVGGGMASNGLCDRLVKSGAVKNYKVSVFGDEPLPAYDRVNLSQLFTGCSASGLQLAGREWYADHKIDLHTGCRIASIDRESREVVDQGGERYSYNRLVLATGSRPKIPPIEGADLPGVFVYRTLEDLEQIQQFVEERRASVGAVIGGGLPN